MYSRTMKSKSGEGPLFTTVSSPKEVNNKLNKVADFLTRRDFIYLVVILSIFKHLDWFLISSGIGAPVFFLVILFLSAKESGR